MFPLLISHRLVSDILCSRRIQFFIGDKSTLRIPSRMTKTIKSKPNKNVIPYQGVSNMVLPHIQRFLRDAFNSMQFKMDNMKSWPERIALIV